MTAPSDAPADTPSSPGSARGLRVKPCNTAPHRPSVPPTAIASTVRGNLSSVTISDASVACGEKSPSHISAGLTHTRPASKETTDSAANVTSSTPTTIASLVNEPLAVLAGDVVAVRTVSAVSLTAVPGPRHDIQHGAPEVACGDRRGLRQSATVQRLRIGDLPPREQPPHHRVAELLAGEVEPSHPRVAVGENVRPQSHHLLEVERRKLSV